MTEPDYIDHMLLRADVEAKIAANDARLAALRERGAPYGMTLDASVFVMNMLVKIKEAVFGDMDDPRRLRFELELAEMAETILNNTEPQIDAQINRARLAAIQHGGQPPPMPGGGNGGGLILP